MEVYDRETGIWVSKQDIGTTGQTEKEKSQASDSFKRACFNWGIGRELYTAPHIWIPAAKAGICKQGGRFCSSERFSVAPISYNSDREISGLSIADGSGRTVFEMRQRTGAAGTEKKGELSPGQMKQLSAELERTGVGMDDVRQRYQFSQPEEMSAELYAKVMKALAKTKSVKAA